jgi:hypothetical protein
LTPFAGIGDFKDETNGNRVIQFTSKPAFIEFDNMRSEKMDDWYNIAPINLNEAPVTIKVMAKDVDGFMAHPDGTFTPRFDLFLDGGFDEEDDFYQPARIITEQSTPSFTDTTETTQVKRLGESVQMAVNDTVHSYARTSAYDEFTDSTESYDVAWFKAGDNGAADTQVGVGANFSIASLTQKDFGKYYAVATSRVRPQDKVQLANIFVTRSNLANDAVVSGYFEGRVLDSGWQCGGANYLVPSYYKTTFDGTIMTEAARQSFLNQFEDAFHLVILGDNKEHTLTNLANPQVTKEGQFFFQVVTGDGAPVVNSTGTLVVAISLPKNGEEITAKWNKNDIRLLAVNDLQSSANWDFSDTAYGTSFMRIHHQVVVE